MCMYVWNDIDLKNIQVQDPERKFLKTDSHSPMFAYYVLWTLDCPNNLRRFLVGTKT